MILAQEIRGDGYDKFFKYKLVNNHKNRYMYEITSPNGVVYYHVFTTTKKEYPQNQENIYSLAEALEKFNKGL